MKDFKDKVALVTGAANGFGKEFMKECAARGMKIAAVDIEFDEVKEVCKMAEEMGAEAIPIYADVTKFEDAEQAVNKTMETYGRIDLLINNAGVAFSGRIWNVPIRDWEWIMHANVFSHVYFMKLVIPIMLEQKTHCNIVNVASIAGLITMPRLTPYHASKHAAVVISEAVSYDLQAIGADIAVSVYCPGFVQTDLHRCERHRPEQYTDDSDPYYKSEEYFACLKSSEQAVCTGIPVDSVGMRVFNAIEEDQFWILTHPQYNTLIGKRVKDMLEGKGPDIRTYQK